MKEYDYSKIKGKVRELNMTLGQYAEYIGISEVSLNHRFNNKRFFTQKEMDKTMELFNEPIDKVCVYFFTKKVQKNRT